MSRVFAQTTIRIVHYQDETTVPDNIGGDATVQANIGGEAIVPDNIGGEATVQDNIGGEATVPDNIGGEATVSDNIQEEAIVSDNIGEATAFEKEETNEVIEQPKDGSVTHTESDLGHQNGPISRGTIAKPKVVPKSRSKSGPIVKPQSLNQSLQDFMSVYRRKNLQPRSD